MTSNGSFEFAHEHGREVVWVSQKGTRIPVHADLEAIRAGVEERYVRGTSRSKDGTPYLASRGF